jgi:hypothetical protein
LATWQGSRPTALTRVARRSLQMPDAYLARRDVLVQGWVQRLTPAMRDRLASRLRAASPEHGLLPYLTRAVAQSHSY